MTQQQNNYRRAANVGSPGGMSPQAQQQMGGANQRNPMDNMKGAKVSLCNRL